jgi:hypothetical protein
MIWESPIDSVQNNHALKERSRGAARNLATYHAFLMDACRLSEIGNNSFPGTLFRGIVVETIGCMIL